MTAWAGGEWGGGGGGGRMMRPDKIQQALNQTAVVSLYPCGRLFLSVPLTQVGVLCGKVRQIDVLCDKLRQIDVLRDKVCQTDVT